LNKPQGLALPIAGNATTAAAVKKKTRVVLRMATSFRVTMGLCLLNQMPLLKTIGVAVVRACIVD
jgi:hypothetical protein